MKDVYIGFNYGLTGHSYSIVVLYDGELRAIELERINRLKASPRELMLSKKVKINGELFKSDKVKFTDKIDELGMYPINIDNFIKLSKINSKIGIYPTLNSLNTVSEFDYFKLSLEYIFSIFDFSKKTDLHIINSPIKIRDVFKEYKNINYINFKNHHLAHASSAFYPSTFFDSAIMCMDGVGYEDTLGKYVSHSLWFGKGTNIDFIYASEYDGSNIGIGQTYSIISRSIGYGEGTIMGLSAYGNSSNYNDINFFEKKDGKVTLNKIFYKGIQKSFYNNINTIKDEVDLVEGLLKNIFDLFGIVGDDYIQKKVDITNSKFADIACKLQKDTEDAIVYLAKIAYEKTKSKNICLAGGVALNVLANTRIIEETGFENIFIQPASKDSGLSLGVLLYNYHQTNKEKIEFNSASLGKTYSDLEIEKYLKKYEKYLGFKKVESINKSVVKHLVEDKIVGWFHSGSEFGPRALGFRSILASPLNADNKDKVNRIKRRQNWRPFAPILTEESVKKYFKNGMNSGFMTLVGNVCDEKISIIPSVVHVDGTARYQTVNLSQNKKIYDLLKEFDSITGESILLNTSFNVGKEPIVETPGDAIKAFLSTEIDILVINDFLIYKNINKVDEYNFNREHILIDNLKNIALIENDSLVTLEKIKLLEQKALNKEIKESEKNKINETINGILEKNKFDKNKLNNRFILSIINNIKKEL